MSVTDKDRESADMLIRRLYKEFSSNLSARVGISSLETEIACHISSIRAESAEQARKEAAERVRKVMNVSEGGSDTIDKICAAILGDSAAVSTDSEKLAIAVKALEEIKTLGTHSTLSGRTTTGERIDSTTIINTYGIKARDALKEIQG